MEKIQGYQFAIDMDDGGMTRTMRELKNEAKLLKSGMQANFAEIRSGEGIMAAYANKVKDAGRAIDAQRVYIEKLKSEQNGLDQSTVHGRESYLKYENQIESAKRTIGSLQSQQERAKQSLDLQKSGVLQLKDATELNDKVTQSYIGRLKAEGNEFEANKAKAGGLHQSYKDLNKQLEAEQSQLEKVGKASGENSRQYKEQQVRVNDLGTKIAETRTKMKELDGQLGKKPHTGLTGVIGQLNKVQEHTTKVDHLFGKVFGAHLLANGVVNAWQSLTSHIGEAVEAGKEYDKEQQKMNATWTTLTGNAKDGKAMVDVTNKLSVALGQDVDVTDELNQQFYHVLDKQGPTEKLTKSVLTMGDAVGMSGDNVKNLGLNFTHMMSSSKMQLGDFNHITDALPMYGEALLKYEQQVQKNSKLTMSQLRKQMSAGKITAEDAEKVMNRLGGKYQEASENLMKTIPGMERVIKSRVPALLGDIEKPIMNAQNPIYGAVSKWVSDKRTEQEFTKVGTAANKGLTTVTKAFAKAFDVKSAPKLMDDAMNGLANGVTKASNAVARNAPEITDFFKTVKNLGGVGFETLIDSLKITNAILKPTLSLVGGHTETIAKFGAAWWVANKAIKGTSDVLSTFKKVSDTVSWAAKVFGIKQETKALAEQNGVLKTNAELSAAGGGSSGGSKVAEEVSGGADGKVAKELAETEKGGAKLGKFAKMGERLKSLKSISGAGKALVGSTGVLDVLMAGTDLIGTTKKNVGDHVGGATGNLAGGAIGGTIGTLIAPGIGTAIGAGIGSMGGDKLGRLIGKKIQGGLSKTKLKIPKPKPLSMKSSYDKLNKQAKSYYSKKAAQDKADLKLLLKNGDITKAEYDRRMKDVKKSTESESRYEKMSQSDRTAVAKYYSQSRAKLTSSWNSKITKDTKKWNSKIAKDTRLYGSQSLQVEKDENRKRAAIRKDESKKKSALSKQELKFATQMTAREARLHTTLTGKIKLASDQQSKILTKLKDKKNKLSKQQLQTAVNSSRKEYQQTVSNANKEYKSRVSDAEHQHDKITKAAERQYKSTVASAKRQYSGNSKYAKQQRQKIISEALEQENKTEKHADEQYKKVTDRAEKQKTQSINSAKNQHTKVVKEAKAQNSEVTDESDSQRKTVNDNNDKTKKHSDSVWKDITKTVGGWLGGIAHSLNKSAKSQNESFKQYGGSGTTLSTSIPESYPAKQYATGTGILNAFRKPISEPTLAMLNDGLDSPETGNRELAFLPNGNILAPDEPHWTGILPAGTEVANASESKLLAPLLGIEHFNTGTGLLGAAGKFFKGIWGSMMSRIKAASSILDKSDKSWGSVFDVTSNGKGDLAKAYTKLTKSNFNRAGKAWWHEAWSQINGAINDGGGGSGDGSLKPHFGSPFSESSGYGPRSGDVTDNHKGIDFSAPMGTPIPAQYAGTVVTAGSASGFGNWVVIKPDGQDINTIYGHMRSVNVHAGEHVSAGQTIARVGAEGEATGPHVHYELRKGLGSGDYRPNPETYKGTVKESSKKYKASSSLSGLVHKELGPGLFSWIEKNLAPLMSDGGSIGSFGLTGSVAKRARTLADAIKKLDSRATKNGIAAVLGNWSFESGLNSGSTNSSGGATGLGQWLGTRKSNLIAFAQRKGKSWHDPSVQLEFALNGEGSDSSLLRRIIESNDSVASLATRFSEGWERGGYTAQHVAGARNVASALKGYANGGIGSRAGLYPLFEGNKPEAVVPMDLSKRSRAYQVMQEIMANFASQDKPTNTAGLRSTNNAVKIMSTNVEERLDSMLALMTKLLDLNASQITAIKAGAFDKTQLYKQQGYDQAMADAQNF